MSRRRIRVLALVSAASFAGAFVLGWSAGADPAGIDRTDPTPLTREPIFATRQPDDVGPARADDEPGQLVASRSCNDTVALVVVDRTAPVHERPDRSSDVVGTMPTTSSYLGTSMVVPIARTSPDGQWGAVDVPWSDVPTTGWIDLAATTPAGSTTVRVRVDVSDRVIVVTDGCDEVMQAPVGVGGPDSPTPTGRMWVTDELEVPPDQPQYGTYAFGLSSIQPSPPEGWLGDDQMAIHGTDDPSSIGQAVSAGCVRASERVLRSLAPLVAPGTPVVIVP